MSGRVEEVQDRLRETQATIARLEKSLALHRSRTVEASLRSLYKLNHVYEEEFRTAASVDLVDVVSYRIFDGLNRPSISLVGRALDYFQTLYAVLYSAVLSGPKSTMHVSPDILADTTFQFAYAYSGSTGFVFTLPNERLLAGETNLDEAMSDLFALAKVTDTDAIKNFARQFGLAPIRAMYKWAAALTNAHVGIDIQWQRDDSLKTQLVLQPAEVEALRDWISATSDLSTKEYDAVGTLLGYDSAVHNFRFDPVDGAVFRGTVADNAELPNRPVIHGAYQARVRTTTRTKYATEESDVSHQLLGLYPRK